MHMVIICTYNVLDTCRLPYVLFNNTTFVDLCLMHFIFLKALIMTDNFAQTMFKKQEVILFCYNFANI